MYPYEWIERYRGINLCRRMMGMGAGWSGKPGSQVGMTLPTTAARCCSWIYSPTDAQAIAASKYARPRMMTCSLGNQL